MSSSSYAQDKGAHASHPSTSSTSYSNTSSRSNYTASTSSSRNYGYGNKPPIIHNGGGQINDPNTSSSAPNGGYYN